MLVGSESRPFVRQGIFGKGPDRVSGLDTAIPAAILPPMRTALAALALVVAAGSVQAVELLPQFKPNTLYTDARTSLLNLGWQPVPASSRVCDGRENTCEVYPEAESCAPFGSAACSMLWKRGEQLISVTTIGDNDILVRSASCRSGC